MKYADDSIVVKQAMQGDESSFALLVGKYKGTIHAIVYHYVGNFHDAEEITQEVFIKAYRSLKMLEEPGKFGGWLHQIARNHAISWLRRVKMAEMQIECESKEVIKASLKQYDDDKLHESVIDAMHSLPENEKMVVSLYYLGGATSSEISRILDVPSGTVRYWLYCAREHLREGFGMVKNELQMKRLSSDFTDQIMDSLGKIEGNVIGMDGKPLGNIKLTLDTIIGDDWFNSSDYIQVDENGHFVMDVPAIIQRFIKHVPNTVECRIMYFGKTKQGILHASTPVITLHSKEKYNDCILDLRHDIHKLRLRILDTESAPIPDAEVTLNIVYNGKGGHAFSGAIKTKEDGLTPQILLSSFEYAFNINAPAKAPKDWIKIKIPEEIPESGVFDIVLENGGKISGKVTNSDENLVANASLNIRYYADEASGHRIAMGCQFGQISDSNELQTNDDGKFTITTLYPIGAYTIQAFHPDHGVDGIVDIPVGSNDVIFKLKPAVSLVGKVMKGKQPAGDALIQVALAETTAKYKVFENIKIVPYYSAITDSLGTFRIPYLFPESTYRLEIQHHGSEYKDNIQMTSQSENHITIHLD